MEDLFYFILWWLFSFVDWGRRRGFLLDCGYWFDKGGQKQLSGCVELTLTNFHFHQVSNLRIGYDQHPCSRLTTSPRTRRARTLGLGLAKHTQTHPRTQQSDIRSHDTS